MQIIAYLDLVDFRLAHSANGEQILPRAVRNRLHGVIAIALQLLDVRDRNANSLRWQRGNLTVHTITKGLPRALRSSGSWTALLQPQQRRFVSWRPVGRRPS